MVKPHPGEQSVYQSAAERDRLLDHVEKQGDGYMFIVNLNDPEGHVAAEKLAEYEDVAEALAIRVEENLLHCDYMLVLLPFTQGGRAAVAFTVDENLEESVALMHLRSRDFGDLFACIVCPTNPRINALFTDIQDVAGSA